MAERTSSADLRRLILDTTRHLLVEKGYADLSMRKIAKAIGYSATSIYLHFENKDALFHALIEEGMERLLAELKQAEAAHPGDPVARLEALCQAYVHFGLENPEYYEIMLLLHPAHMARYPADKFRRARRNLDVIEAALIDGVNQGVMQATNTRVSTSVIWAALHGAVSLLNAKRVDIRIAHKDLIAETVRHTLRGCCPSLER